MSKVVCVIPTIRPASMKKFLRNWQPLFDRHSVELVTVHDGENPIVTHEFFKSDAKKIMGKYAGAIINFNGGVRNLGFAYVAKHIPDAEYILTLDDDTRPVGDTVYDHLAILNQKVPINWFSTASEYMRGFPYKVRSEAEVVLSHGVWEGVADWDAPTQLVKGSHRPVTFPRCPVPKGAYFPMCIMNVMFKRKMLPFMYQAPPAPDMNIGRTDDIYCGVLAKREIDKRGWAAVTGYARLHHERESDVYKNLNAEAKTIELMEDFWQGKEKHEYFELYKQKRELWQSFLQTLI